MTTGQSVRVLVVEDEPLIAMALEDALVDKGCKVVGPFAELGDALKAANCENFDCAILDINIRGGLSYPVAGLLIERGCPILLATGYRNAVLPQNLVDQPIIAKPYSAAQLDTAIEQLCDRV